MTAVALSAIFLGAGFEGDHWIAGLLVTAIVWVTWGYGQRQARKANR